MDLLAFIHVPDPTKVKIKERERAKREARILYTTVGRVVLLLPVAPDNADSELEASVEKLFDDSADTDQGNFVAGGGQEAEAEIVAGVRFVERENVAAEKLKCPRKKRQAATDSDNSSHPLKKLRSDHGTLSRATSVGTSPTALKKLLANNLLNVESGVEAVATLPFVTSFVFATPEHEGGVPANSITELNLRTIGASERFVISLNSFHHSCTNVLGAEGDFIIRSVVVPPVMFKAVITTHVASIPSDTALKPGTKVITPAHASVFHDSESTRMVRPDVAGSSYFLEKELSIGSRECWDCPPGLFECEVRMRNEYCLRERNRLESEFEKQTGLLKSQDEEIKSLKAQLLQKEAESAEVARLRTRVSAFEAAEQVHVDELNTLKQKNVVLEDEKESLNGRVAELESLVSIKDREPKDVDATVRALEISSSGLQEIVSVYENCMKQLEKFQDDWMKVVNDKFDQLHTDFVEMALHLEEKFYHHLLTTISFRRWVLTQGMKLAVVKCLNSPEYLFVLGAAISKAIEKEADYVAALQRLQSVNFSLLTELKANKDASAKTLFDLLHLEESLAERLGLHELQPSFNQLMVPIQHSPNQTVVGATVLSLALDVSDIRVQKIRENITNRRSALHDVFVSLAKPFSSAALVGTEGTSNVIPAAVHTTTALSTTFASASTVPPITIEDYELIGTDGPEGAQGSGEVASFPHDAFSLSRMFAGYFSSAGLAIPLMYLSCLLVLRVGMPISTGITAFVPYVSENGVSSLLVFIMVGEAGRCHFAKRVCFLFSPLVLNLNLKAYVNSVPSRFMIIRPAQKPSIHKDPSVNNIHGSGSSFMSSIVVSNVSSYGSSIMKSARICPFTDILVL
uniref:Transposase (Putative), gypsy type n=1 Tax=Tanacetum cinerariifolium TaxID=118510 RepID=A0A6L2J6D4_TANCI|nr:hypothetical protein [Tanacetum cinerariifolium]